MFDHSHVRRRIQRQQRLSRETLTHLLLITSILAVGGWIATGLLLWMLATAALSF